MESVHIYFPFIGEINIDIYRPIKHFLCECGNPLAGVINICELGNSEEDAIKYAKELIADYNEGGLYFKRSLLDQANYIIQMKGIK